MWIAWEYLLSRAEICKAIPQEPHIYSHRKAIVFFLNFKTRIAVNRSEVLSNDLSDESSNDKTQHNLQNPTELQLLQNHLKSENDL